MMFRSPFRRAKRLLVGRNGEGKSTLLKVLAGVIEPDSRVGDSGGWRGAGFWTSHASHQSGGNDSLISSPATYPKALQLLRDYHALSHQAHGEADLQRLSALHAGMDLHDAWSLNQRAQRHHFARVDPEARLRGSFWRLATGYC